MAKSTATIIREHYVQLGKKHGSKAGKAGSALLTKAQRVERASNAALARWAKVKKNSGK